MSLHIQKLRFLPQKDTKYSSLQLIKEGPENPD